jgi:diguanylate cyclase (GGDEF)-like protein/PAS domain S-box-containing protein
MDRCARNILVIGNDAAAVAAIRGAIAESGNDASARAAPAVDWAQNLSAGIARLGEEGIDAVVLDLAVPGGRGIDCLSEVLLAVRRIPVVVLMAAGQEGLGRLAIERGAKECLLKERFDGFSFRLMLQRVLERAMVDEALLRERERAQSTLNSMGDGVICIDNEGRVTYLNPVAEKLTGWSHRDAAGRMNSEVLRIIDSGTRESGPSCMELAALQNKSGNVPPNSVLVRRDGTESTIADSIAPIHDRDGHVTGAVMVLRDVSEARVQELKLSHLAQHDILTGLPNRLLLYDRLNQAIALARRHGGLVGVLFLDLDRFKNINDSLGHAIGDQLLQAMGKSLVAAARESDIVSRLGGDEFVVVLSDLKLARNAGRYAEKVRAALSAPHFIARHELHVNVSIGISIFPDDGQDAESLVKCADTAMYQAKENGRNTYRFFKPEMNSRAVERKSVEQNLRRALERAEFVLLYQSKTNLESGTVTGVEALLRWMHPERGLLSPAQFVPIAEDCGLIVPIGQWVLREACRRARTWQDAGLPPVPVAVNVSATELRHGNFLAGVREALVETHLDPCYLELELAERALMHDVDSTAAVLRALKAIGVRLAIDDFGTGNSSLSYLRQFPFDTLKIDQSFVRYCTTDPEGSAIVSAVIGLGRSLRQTVVAEGIETREQLDFLHAHQCHEGQGYYFDRPVVAGSFAAWFDARSPRQLAATKISAHSVR